MSDLFSAIELFIEHFDPTRAQPSPKGACTQLASALKGVLGPTQEDLAKKLFDRCLEKHFPPDKMEPETRQGIWESAPDLGGGPESFIHLCDRHIMSPPPEKTLLRPEFPGSVNPLHQATARFLIERQDLIEYWAASIISTYIGCSNDFGPEISRTNTLLNKSMVSDSKACVWYSRTHSGRAVFRKDVGENAAALRRFITLYLIPIATQCCHSGVVQILYDLANKQLTDSFVSMMTRPGQELLQQVYKDLY